MEGSREVDCDGEMMPLGTLAYMAWMGLIREEIVSRASLVQAFLSGRIKECYRTWLGQSTLNPYAAVALRHFDELRWDDSLIGRFGGIDIPEPPMIRSEKRYVVTRYDGNRRATPICDFVERSVTAAEHGAICAVGASAPIPNKLGLRLRVARYHGRLDPEKYNDNTPAVYLMADANTGLAGPPWTSLGVGGLGPVDVACEDGDFGVVDAALVQDYMDNLMDRWGNGRPTDRLNPVAFQDFLKVRADRVRRGHNVQMDSGEAALVVFRRSDELHVESPRVILSNLTTSGFNGKTAVLGRYDAASARFNVFPIDTPSRGVRIRPENLILLDADGRPVGGEQPHPATPSNAATAATEPSTP
mmetsp:Transcript_29589/g.90534  ORF Transcript_29589/g.90534 Transcript_29589/m.90534 type:complete len:359 (+) Transcript_29589:158-1234(+)